MGASLQKQTLLRDEGTDCLLLKYEQLKNNNTKCCDSIFTLTVENVMCEIKTLTRTGLKDQPHRYLLIHKAPSYVNKQLKVICDYYGDAIVSSRLLSADNNGKALSAAAGINFSTPLKQTPITGESVLCINIDKFNMSSRVADVVTAKQQLGEEFFVAYIRFSVQLDCDDVLAAVEDGKVVISAQLTGIDLHADWHVALNVFST